MTNFHNITPKIEWGASFANTLNVGYPVDNFATWTEPRQGSQWIQSQSGLEDSWIIGYDYYLQVDIRWIPTTDTDNPVATGWDGATKWRGFMEWALARNTFLYYPNKNEATNYESYLVSPLEGGPSLEPDGTKRITLIMRNPTSPYEGY